MKADVTATKSRGFEDKRSYVKAGGEEVLYGKDWDNRRFELLKRCGGQCEFGGSAYIRCARHAEDPHHIVLRSARRDDRMSNLLAVCRFHHDLLDREQRKAKIEARKVRMSA